MKLAEGFMKFAEEQNIDANNIFTDKGEGYTIISFGEEGEPGIVYNVALILYDDDNQAEVYVRKSVNTSNMPEVLTKLNKLNNDYRGVSFFANDSLVNIKSYCEANGDIEVVLKQMLQTMRVASEEFSKFN